MKSSGVSTEFDLTRRRPFELFSRSEVWTQCDQKRIFTNYLLVPIRMTMFFSTAAQAARALLVADNAAVSKNRIMVTLSRA